MLLYLVRHGLAIDREDPECPPDPKRFLTRKGIEKTREVVMGLRALGIKPDEMISSPYVRAVQTAEIAAQALDFPRDKIRHSEALLPPAKPLDIFKELAKCKGNQVMCFGHAPNLDEVIAVAIGSRATTTALKKAGAACIEFESPAPGKGTLVWVCPPKMLRAMGK